MEEKNNYNIEKKILKESKINSDSFDIEIIGSPVRFTIMLLLNTHQKIPNTELRKLLEISAGKLDHHVRILEKEEYIIKGTHFFPSRPGTLITITEKGKKAFIQYSKQLRDVLNNLEI